MITNVDYTCGDCDNFMPDSHPEYLNIGDCSRTGDCMFKCGCACKSIILKKDKEPDK